MKPLRLGILLWLGFLASACSPRVEVGPGLHIAISPAAQPVSTAVAVCMPSVENLSPTVEIRYSEFVDAAQVDLFLRLGEPIEVPEFAAQVAWENVIVIVHPDNPLDLNRSQLAGLFSSRVVDWSELGGEPAAVSLWVGPESDETRQAFQTGILLGSPVAGSANLATNPEDLLAAVASDPAAAGILPAAWADGTVRSIDTSIELPVLALAAGEPSGAARELLACLQGEVGQAALAELYAPLEP